MIYNTQLWLSPPHLQGPTIGCFSSVLSARVGGGARPEPAGRVTSWVASLPSSGKAPGVAGVWDFILPPFLGVTAGPWCCGDAWARGWVRGSLCGVHMPETQTAAGIYPHTQVALGGGRGVLQERSRALSVRSLNVRVGVLVFSW